MTVHILQLESPIEGQEAIVAAARAVLKTQADALHRVADHLGPEFCRALEMLYRCTGRVVVCGMGKSGLIGKKIAATFSCAGTPSLFLHPADAAHGDLGMVTRSDVVLLVSHSGATEELLKLLPYFEELGVPIVALVGRSGSPLARAADVVICTRVEREACPHNAMVTTSALVTMALADALALALMRQRNVTAAELSGRHPGGALSKTLASREERSPESAGRR